MVIGKLSIFAEMYGVMKKSVFLTTLLLCVAGLFAQSFDLPCGNINYKPQVQTVLLYADDDQLHDPIIPLEDMLGRLTLSFDIIDGEGEVLNYTFMRYNAVASEVGSVSESTINGYVVDYDGVDYFNEAGDVFTQAEIDAALPGDMAYGQQAGKPKGSILASKIYYCWIENPNDNSYFANKKLRTLYIFNKESKDLKNWNSVNTPKKFMEYIQKEVDKLNDPSVVVAPNPEKVKRIQQLASYTWIPDPENPSATLTSAIPSADYFNWYYSENGYAKNQVLYSLYGFIHGGATDKSNYYFVRDGKEELIGSLGQFQAHPTNLPVVRYLLPIPREAITRSEGAYKNYYGY
jgi:hypothetical protein